MEDLAASLPRSLRVVSISPAVRRSRHDDVGVGGGLGRRLNLEVDDFEALFLLAVLSEQLGSLLEALRTTAAKTPLEGELRLVPKIPCRMPGRAVPRSLRRPRSKKLPKRG